MNRDAFISRLKDLVPADWTVAMRSCKGEPEGTVITFRTSIKGKSARFTVESLPPFGDKLDAWLDENLAVHHVDWAKEQFAKL